MVRLLLLMLLLTLTAWAGPGFLGVACADLTAEAIHRQHLTIQHGAVVTTVLPGSPAASIGILPGDVIYALNDTPITGGQNLISVTNGARPGTPVDVKLFRNGRQLTLRTALADRDQFKAALTQPPPLPNANVKDQFLKAIRAYVQGADAGDGLSSLYFILADEEALVRANDSYLLGVAVDPVYLGSFKWGSYLDSLQHKKVTINRGLTQPKGLGADWDAAVTPQESRYNGWVILADSPLSDPATALHEAIHVVHLILNSSADDDKYAGPEDICNTFRAVVAYLRTTVDPLIEQAAIKAAAGGDISRDKAMILQRVEAQRQRLSLTNDHFRHTLANIGGKADFNGYIKAIEIKLRSKKKPTTKPPTPVAVSVIGFWKGTWVDSNGSRGNGKIQILWHDPTTGEITVDLGNYQFKGQASGNTATWSAPSVGRARQQLDGRFTVEAGNRSATCTITTRSADGTATVITNWQLSR